MIIETGDRVMVSVCRNEDGTNNGSLYVEPIKGHAYCIAKAPRYASDAEWRHNAELIASLVLAGKQEAKNGG